MKKSANMAGKDWVMNLHDPSPKQSDDQQLSLHCGLDLPHHCDWKEAEYDVGEYVHYAVVEVDNLSPRTVFQADGKPWSRK